MSKVTSIERARTAKTQKKEIESSPEGFTPCSQDMTICGDCDDNRAKKKCPRFKEWLAKREG
jgi:hypothetical protein